MYIGQRRFSTGWKSYYGSGIHYKRAENIYGKENFSRQIIHFGHSKEELNKLERYYISKYNAVESDEYYNIADGGNCANNFAGKSEEEKTEIAKKIGNSHLGKPLSEEHKKKLSRAFSGTSHPFYGKTGINSSFYGKQHSEETKKKISQSHIGKKHSEEHIRKNSESHTGICCGKDNPRARSVVLVNTGELFQTIKEAGLKYDIFASSITACCKGKLKSAGKHPETGERLVWEYCN